MKKIYLIFFIPLIYCINACTKSEQKPTKPQQIAFLADVHLTNIFGHLSDSEYKGIENPATGEYVIARTMASQLHSTRIFNENYFAFIAALDDITERGIKLVAFPGDYTDDGQAVHVRGLREILKKYEEQYNMQFMITTGNHDPVRPFHHEAGKSDFLGEGGKNQPIFSKANMYQINPDTDFPVVETADIAEMGYKGILDELGSFGFTPNENYLYWSTPFSDYNVDDYSFEKARKAAELSNRTYEVAPGFTVPDVTYLVEPVEDIWLLAIDGNIYVPKDESGDENDPDSYKSPSLGFNNLSDNKDYLISWISKVFEQAETRGKTVIAFSHYPMVDFNDDASPILKLLLGENKWQLARVPEERIAKVFADAGIQIHVAGHMHINDTGIRTSSEGNILVNIQTPSLAAYQPGYKILTVHSDNKIEVETVKIDSVPRFKELFALYEIEYDFLKSLGEDNLWDRSILEVDSYHDFMLWHLKELVRLRFLNDWPEPIKSFITEKNLREIAGIIDVELPNEADQFFGYDLLIDFYKIRNADLLALNDISEEQLELYQQLIKAYKTVESKDELTTQLKEFFEILDHFLNGKPADHFMIDLRQGTVKEYLETTNE
ncbi:metallophosphoesterase family protein [Chondrinema litorale]|uniref:metallophosphoesterase family protein n=1 Tax=Chondrinema litorale TaxID=2994555 RepID=UPI002542A113|nr:metallophosphoesterase [Chondrinema litorale]UZR98434.1 metallophosphoesterase [Chondrinema litorale]